MTRSDLLRAAEAIITGAEARHPWLSSAGVAGIGWATVDLDRAASELEAVGGGQRWVSAPRDELLGATARVANGPTAAEAGGPTRKTGGAPTEDAAVLLLEPDTEGRLAASLVRFDEGVAAVYVLVDAGDDALGPEGDGPLGRGRLVPGESRWGPHIIVLERASVP